MNERRLLWAWRVAVLACLAWVTWEFHAFTESGSIYVNGMEQQHRDLELIEQKLDKLHDQLTYLRR